MADITSPRNLNAARRHRSCPRVVRRARHNSYRVKRTGDASTRHHGPPTIRLVNLPTTIMINLGQVALSQEPAMASLPRTAMALTSLVMTFILGKLRPCRA
jgi:hypothetical protein